MKKQNLNIGDELLCKKSLFDETIIDFESNKYYKIYNIKIFFENIYVYYMIDINNDIFEFHTEDNLYDYFYTKNEERKIKLNNLINEEAES
jgi:hypothetical protein